MKFTHIADIHLGSWREAKLKDLNMDAFKRAINKTINAKADFMIISGDLFHTSLPSIDVLRETVRELKKLKNNNIPVYIIAGSHDFSVSGKTILDILEEADLVINVTQGSAENNTLKLRFTIDEKTGAKICGMLGKKGMLDRKYYEQLDKENLEKENGFKIFLFHTALSEFKPKELEQVDVSPLSLLPKNFNYYAGGHVHYIFEKDVEGYGKIVYPGPIYPNNFKELEDLQKGGMYFYNEGKLEWIPLQIKNVYKLKLDCNKLTPDQIKSKIIEEIKHKEFINTIVTLRLEGKIEGKVSDINFKEIIDLFNEKSAYFIMKNSSKLIDEEYRDVKINEGCTDEIERRLIEETSGSVKINAEEKGLIKELMNGLNLEKGEGEKSYEFEKRVINTSDAIVKNRIQNEIES